MANRVVEAWLCLQVPLAFAQYHGWRGAARYTERAERLRRKAELVNEIEEARERLAALEAELADIVDDDDNHLGPRGGPGRPRLDTN